MSSLRNNLWAGLVIGLIVGAGIGAGATFILFPLGVTSGTGSASITTAGSTTVFPLSEVWAEEYYGVYPNTTVLVAAGGSGFGQTAVGVGDVDIGASSSPIKSANLATYPGLKQIPIALDGLAIIFNAEVNGTGMQKFTREAVIAIFQGNLTTWEQVESQFGVDINKTGAINVYARSDASGTTDTFSRWLETNDTYWLLGHGETISWGSHVVTVQGNPGVALAVSLDKSAIGYVGLAFANETTNPDIKKVHLKNPTTGEYVEASVTSVKATVPTEFTESGQSLFNANLTGSYPIARMLYYVLNNESVSHQPLKYIRWCLGSGQTFVQSVGYIDITGTAIETFSNGLITDLEGLI
ncbi:MAG: PstS family phosphate ABC transporter substrate-binding protein [Candidatus Ranarchaeia archaeon]